jgi:uncharacterized alkaline shock family protein YloU
MDQRQAGRAAGAAPPEHEVVIDPPVVAAIAAHAAAAVPGVARLEPGVSGLIKGWQRATRGRWSGQDPAPAAGATAAVTDGIATIHLDVAVTGGYRVPDVAADVQRTVADSVSANTALEVSTVSVSVLDIDPYPTAGGE